MILADTKFEWGSTDETGELLLIDEVLTPDSSRYWPLETYRPGGPQPSFDKQFVRDWLETTGWDKASPPPSLPDDVVAKTRGKYVEAYEILTGQVVPLEMTISSELVDAMLRYLTAGESHGPALTAIVEGFPSGVALDTALIDRELERRQGGYGRGKRQTARDRPDHRRVGRLSRRDDRRADHAATDQQRRQARAPGRAGRAARRPYRPGRLDQLSDRHPPGARARQRPRDRAAGRGRRRWPSSCCASWGSRSSAMSASWAGSAAPPASFDPAVRDASPVYTLNPEADPAIVAAIDAARRRATRSAASSRRS